MEKTIIIGNLTRDPETRTTAGGVSVCSFTVAVNGRKRSDGEQPPPKYFRVSAWRQLGELCQKYLEKGKKVYIEGSIQANPYQSSTGECMASLDLTAENVEFLSAVRGRSED